MGAGASAAHQNASSSAASIRLRKLMVLRAYNKRKDQGIVNAATFDDQFKSLSIRHVSN